MQLNLSVARDVLFAGRQLLMSGRVISPQEFCAAIDNVKESDIKRCVFLRRLFQRRVDSSCAQCAYGGGHASCSGYRISCSNSRTVLLDKTSRPILRSRVQL